MEEYDGWVEVLTEGQHEEPNSQPQPQGNVIDLATAGKSELKRMFG